MTQWDSAIAACPHRIRLPLMMIMMNQDSHQRLIVAAL